MIPFIGGHSVLGQVLWIKSSEKKCCMFFELFLGGTLEYLLNKHEYELRKQGQNFSKNN